jgi:aldose 1-epimerase
MIKVKEKGNFVIISVIKENLEVELMNYGATIYGLKTRNYLGKMEDIVLQYADIDDYINNNIYLNGTIGPVAGRIRDGKISTRNKVFELNKNSDGLHTLHSGEMALTYKYFDYEISESSDYTEVIFLYEETEKLEYQVKVIYQIYDSKLVIGYEVETEEDSVFNLTNHAYFNLSGNLKSDVKNHEVFLSSKTRHVLDNELVFTGDLTSEDPTYDFTETNKIETALRVLQETPKGGVDDIYFFENNHLHDLMAVVYEPVSRRVLKVSSTYDHLVFYTHNNINKLPLKHLDDHKEHYALCFECQKSPYGFNKPGASNPMLKAGKTYQEQIIFEFSVEE